MKRIGVSQRLDQVLGRNEYRDALDHRWSNLLWLLGYMPIPLCSGIKPTKNYLQALKLDAFILSGGNDLGGAPQRDRLETAVLDFAMKEQLPVLGVCRGMQMINHYQGGSLEPVTEHVATEHSLVGEWAKKKGFTKVNSYHNQGIFPHTLGTNLKILATSIDQVVEAVKHQQLPWLGIMWHPEREQPYQVQDLRLLKQFFGD